MELLLKNYNLVTEKEKIKSKSFIVIPNSLIYYSQDTLFSTWDILERQLEQLNPETENDIYAALDDLAGFIFDMWLQFTGV